MGTPRDFICRTCRKDYYLGYGSATTWLTEVVESVAEFDAWPHNQQNKNLAKNQNYRTCLLEHETHDWFTWDDENIDIRNNDKTKLIACYSAGINDYYDTLVENDWDKYEYVDMAKGVDETQAVSS